MWYVLKNNLSTPTLKIILPKKRIEAKSLTNNGQPKNKEEKIMEKVLTHRYKMK